MVQQQIFVDNQLIHFRVIGTGFPVVLLHPSPSSSKMFVPMMEKLKELSELNQQKLCLIAVDTPGYGLSQPLQHTFKSMKDYTALFKKLFDKLELKRFGLYGSATGAQIAIRYALENPLEIEHLFLDNTAHFTKVQRTSILKQYFPDLTPDLEGTHLRTMWKMVCGLFQYFPWFETREEYKINRPMPPTIVLHMVAKDYISAGSNYDVAYKAAFEHERAAFVQELKVPTTIFRWGASIIKPYTDQLLQFEMPEHVKVLDIPPTPDERMQTMGDYILQQCNDPSNTTEGLLDDYIQKESLSISTFPSLSPDEEGQYLMEAWQYLKEKYSENNAEELHEKLNQWIQQI